MRLHIPTHITIPTNAEAREAYTYRWFMELSSRRATLESWEPEACSVLLTLTLLNRQILERGNGGPAEQRLNRLRIYAFLMSYLAGPAQTTVRRIGHLQIGRLETFTTRIFQLYYEHYPPRPLFFLPPPPSTNCQQSLDLLSLEPQTQEPDELQTMTQTITPAEHDHSYCSLL